MSDTNMDSSESLRDRIREVNDLSNSILELLNDQMQGPETRLYEHTPVLLSLVNRVRANVSALIVLIEVKNHYACLFILRSLLEDALIATASHLHSRGYVGILSGLMSGERLTHIDYSGRRYNYSQLCDEQDRLLGNTVGTTQNWYRFLSGFVHFSKSHLSATILEISDDGIMWMLLPRDTFEISRVKDEDVLNWLASAESALTQIANLVRKAP